jgi:hypothetical protein
MLQSELKFKLSLNSYKKISVSLKLALISIWSEDFFKVCIEFFSVESQNKQNNDNIG